MDLGRLPMLCFLYLMFESLEEISGFIYIVVHIILNSCFRQLDGVPRKRLLPNTVCHRPKHKPTRKNYTELGVSADEEFVLVKTVTGNILLSVRYRQRDNQLSEGGMQPSLPGSVMLKTSQVDHGYQSKEC